MSRLVYLEAKLCVKDAVDRVPKFAHYCISVDKSLNHSALELFRWDRNFMQSLSMLWDG